MKANNRQAVFIGIIIILVIIILGLLNHKKAPQSIQKLTNKASQNDTSNNNMLPVTNHNYLKYNGSEYSFTNPICTIQGIKQSNGNVTWGLRLLFKQNNPSRFNSIGFTAHNTANTVESLVTAHTNIASKNVSIENNLTSNTYQRNSGDISINWNTINRNGNSFSGSGAIVFNSTVRPNENVCNGTEMVNQQYLAPNDPNYDLFCPSPVFPAQIITFDCPSGTINPNVSIPL